MNQLKALIQRSPVSVLLFVLIMGTAFSGLYLSLASSRLALQDTQMEGQALARQAAVSLQPYLMAEDAISLNYVLTELTEAELIRGAKVESVSKATLARSGDLAGNEQTVVIGNERNTTGRLTVYLNDEPNANRFSALLSQAFILALLIIAAAGLVTWWITRSMSYRLKMLEQKVIELTPEPEPVKEQITDDNDLLALIGDMDSDTSAQENSASDLINDEELTPITKEPSTETDATTTSDADSSETTSSKPLSEMLNTPIQADTDNNEESRKERETDEDSEDFSALLAQANASEDKPHLIEEPPAQVVEEYLNKEPLSEASELVHPPLNPQDVDEENDPLFAPLPEAESYFVETQEADSSYLAEDAHEDVETDDEDEYDEDYEEKDEDDRTQALDEDLDQQELIALLKPDQQQSRMPQFVPHPIEPTGSSVQAKRPAPEEAFEVDEHEPSERPVHTPAPFKPPRSEEQLDLYTLEHQLELTLPAEDAAYLIYIDATSGHSEYVEPELHELLLSMYEQLLKQVCGIYGGEITVYPSGDMELLFDTQDPEDGHGVHALCAAKLFTLIYRAYNQTRIKVMQPTLNLHTAIVRGNRAKVTRMKEEALFLTRSTQSNDLISHTALTEATHLKSSLLQHAYIQRVEEDKVLIQSMGDSYQDLLRKQAIHLLRKQDEEDEP
jgi:hypothetical protein